MEATSKRLFENNLLERLTHVHHNTPHFIYLPIVFLCLYYSLFHFSFSLTAVAAGFFAGAFSWTLFEYLLHRFMFHYEPTSAFGKRLIYLFHGIHHDNPNEADRLVMPVFPSTLISAVVFSGFYLLLGDFGLPVYAGFVVGYLYYEFVHYSVHFKKKASLGFTQAQRREHLSHHFKDHHRRYGVTSPLWDFVFGTYK